MQYYEERDAYDDRIISFLKQALKEAYERGEFIGGRGPKRFEGESLKYFNHYEGDFKDRTFTFEAQHSGII